MSGRQNVALVRKPVTGAGHVDKLAGLQANAMAKGCRETSYDCRFDRLDHRSLTGRLLGVGHGSGWSAAPVDALGLFERAAAHTAHRHVDDNIFSYFSGP